MSQENSLEPKKVLVDCPEVELETSKDICINLLCKLKAEGSEELSSLSCFMQNLLKENLEHKEEIQNLKNEVETLQNQLCSMQDLSKENLELKEDIQNLKKEMEIHQNQVVTLEGLEAVLKDRLQNQTLETLAITGPLEEKHECLENRVNHLEGEQENILDQVNKLKHHLVDTAIRKKKPAKSEVTDSQSKKGGPKLHPQAADLRNAVQKLEEEMQNVRQELLALGMDQNKSQDKQNWGMNVHELFERFENLESLVNDLMNQDTTVQTTDLADYETLHSKTTELMKEREQEQSHIAHLYKTVKELSEKKAEKQAMKSGDKAIAADVQALETRVMVCETTTERLNMMLQDLPNVTEHEENCNKVIEKISVELECKLNRTELEPLKKQLKNCQMKINKHLEARLVPTSDDDAVVKKRFSRFSCLSCDRPVNMKPGLPLRVLLRPPTFPLPKHFGRLRPCTKLGQRETDSCSFDGHVYKECPDTSYMNAMEVRRRTFSSKAVMAER